MRVIKEGLYKDIDDVHYLLSSRKWFRWDGTKWDKFAFNPCDKVFLVIAGSFNAFGSPEHIANN